MRVVWGPRDECWKLWAGGPCGIPTSLALPLLPDVMVELYADLCPVAFLLTVIFPRFPGFQLWVPGGVIWTLSSS